MNFDRGKCHFSASDFIDCPVYLQKKKKRLKSWDPKKAGSLFSPNFP
jgi:hypothetical protein